MGTKTKSPIGKYFKTPRGNIHFYCYESNKFFGGYNCISIDKNGICVEYFYDIATYPRSTKKAFRKAYAKTIEAIDAIVEGGK